MATRSSAVTSQVVGDGEFAGRSLGYVWNPSTLAYEVATPSTGGGGGGAATIADGADVAEGAKADSAWDGLAATSTLIGLGKYSGLKLEAIRALLAGTVAVSGTFWQATQPISAAALPLPAGAAQDATLTGGTQKAIVRGGAKGATAAADVTSTASGANHQPLDVILYDAAGGVINPTQIRALTNADVVKAQLQDNAGNGIALGQKVMGSSVPVVIASDQTVIPVSDNAGSLTVDAPVATPLFARLSDGAAALIGQKVMASSLPIAIASDQSAVPVTAPALTKGTQGANGFSTQDLKDAGRVRFAAATVIAGVAGVAAEALLSMVPQRDAAPGGAATTFAVTAGKRLRLSSITVGIVSTAAAVVSVRVVLRCNPAGAAAVASPIEIIIAIPSGAALAQAGGFITVPLPDGFEYSGTHQFALTHVGSVATYTLWASLNGYEY